MADLYCTDVQDDFSEVTCGIETGRIVAFALVDPIIDAITDPEDDADWTTAVGASPQGVFVINNGVKGEMPRATETEEEGFGLELVQVVGADHQATLQVKGIKGNTDFMNIVNRKAWGVALVYNRGNDMLYIPSGVTVQGRIVIPAGLNNQAYWEVTFKWTTLDEPSVYTTPASLQPVGYEA